MKIVEYRTKDLPNIKNEWEVLEKGKDMTPFQSFEWNTLLVRQFNKQILRRFYRLIRYLCLYDDDNKIVLIAAVRFKNKPAKNRFRKEIELLGDDSFSDYCNFVYSDVTDDCFRMVFDYMKTTYPKYKISFGSIPSTSKLGVFIENRYEITTRQTVIIKKSSNYFENLSKNMRQNYRTSINRMHKADISYEYKIYKNLDKQLIDKLVRISNARTFELNKDSFNSPFKKGREIIKNKFNNINADSVLTNDKSWVLITYLNGDIAGFMQGMINNGVVYMMTNKVNPKYSYYSPMIVSGIDYIRESFSFGSLDTFDLGRGNEIYKYRLGGEDYILYSVLINNAQK